jgi:hypothetical protein
MNLFPFLNIKLHNALKKYISKHTFLEKCNGGRWNFDYYFNMQKYDPGNYYANEHMEHGWKHNDSKRLLAWMVYLNTINGEGGTKWPQQNFTSKCKSGFLYIWPAGWTHSHHGIVSKKKTKYIITGWCSFIDN